MSQRVCATKGCDRRLNGYKARNRIHQLHCSLYCKLSSERHDKRCHPRESIPQSCYRCGQTFELRYAYNRANQRTCGSECNREIESLRHGRRNFAILNIIYELAPAGSDGIIAEDIAQRMESYPYRIQGAKGISQILKVFVRRGLVTSTTEGNCPVKVFRWTSNPELRPGAL